MLDTLITLPAGRVEIARQRLLEAWTKDERAAIKAGHPIPEAPTLDVVETTTAYVCGQCSRETTLNVDGVTTCHGVFARTRTTCKVSVTVGRPTIGDWELLAVVEPQDADFEGHPSPNLIRTVPGADIPIEAYTEFQACDATWCDHCKAKRNRSETFMIRNVNDVDTILLVGRNCLSAFLGGQPYDAIVARLSWASLVSEAGSNDGWGSGGWHPAPSIEEVLHLTAVSVRVDGWRSKADAQIRNVQSTSDRVRYLCNPPPQGSPARDEWAEECKRLAPQAGDLQRANEALAWVRSELIPTSDFDHSICTVGRQTHVKRYGLACAIYTAWQRATGKAAAKAARVPTSYLGDPRGRRTGKGAKAKMTGTNESITGKIEAMRTLESQYGVTTLVVVRSNDGAHVAQWWKSGAAEDGWNVGDAVTMSGTVKAHEEGKYDLTGDKVTVLTRCVIRKVAISDVVRNDQLELGEVLPFDDADVPF